MDMVNFNFVVYMMSDQALFFLSGYQTPLPLFNNDMRQCFSHDKSQNYKGHGFILDYDNCLSKHRALCHYFY